MKYCKIIGVFALLVSMEILNGQSYFEASRLDFNTRSKELAPAFFKNGLVFCSDRRKDFIVTYTDYNDNPLTNLYFAEKKRNGNFEAPKLMAKELTTFMFEGPSTFSPDGNVIYYTRSINISSAVRNRKADTTFGIFMSRLVDGHWTSPTPFEYNSMAYNSGYPFLSDDGNQLFFCSDNPEGMGGLDIYVCNLVGGKWSKPLNPGPDVNTSKNEVFPFLHKNGMLYFSSRGFNESGDMDIFFTMKKEGIWQKPVRLESPFNTRYDDYGLIFSQFQDTAYFVSDRNGSADIFTAVSKIPLFEGCEDQKENDYCFVFYESNNNDIDTSLFAYEWDLGDGTKIRSIEAEHCFANPGTYLVQLNIIDKLTKEFMVSQATYSFVVENIEQPFISFSDSVYTNRELKVSGAESYLKNFKISNYYWDFGDGTRGQGSEISHTYRFPGTFNIVLGVTGNKEGSEINENHCVTRKIVVLDSNN